MQGTYCITDTALAEREGERETEVVRGRDGSKREIGRVGNSKM